jgi:hypothetical protein
VAYLIVAVLCTLMGAAGYWMYGTGALDLITFNLSGVLAALCASGVRRGAGRGTFSSRPAAPCRAELSFLRREARRRASSSPASTFRVAARPQ